MSYIYYYYLVGSSPFELFLCYMLAILSICNVYNYMYKRKEKKKKEPHPFFFFPSCNQGCDKKNRFTIGKFSTIDTSNNSREMDAKNLYLYL